MFFMLDRPIPPLSVPLDPPALPHELYREHWRWMIQAIALGDRAGRSGDVPVGAVVVDGQGKLLAQGENRREQDGDPTAHAEIVALRRAGRRRGNWHLGDCRLYVSLEPCPMCAGAIVQARIKTLVYGADDMKAGAVRSLLNIPDSPASHHRLEVIGGILAQPARQQLQQWFIQRRSWPQ